MYETCREIMSYDMIVFYCAKLLEVGNMIKWLFGKSTLSLCNKTLIKEIMIYNEMKRPSHLRFFFCHQRFTDR